VPWSMAQNQETTSTIGPTGEPFSNKGKQRAVEPTEHTPLLSSSTTGENYSDDESLRPSGPPTILARLAFVFLVSSVICIVIFFIFALIVWLYASHTTTQMKNIGDAMVVAGPFSVQLLNTSSGHPRLQLNAKAGLDVANALDLESSQDDRLSEKFRKSLMRWGVRKLHTVSVTLDAIHIQPKNAHPVDNLLVISIPPLTLPVAAEPSSDRGWLSNISIPLEIQPSWNMSLYEDFLKQAWELGTLGMNTEICEINVIGGSLHGNTWRKFVRMHVSNFRESISLRCERSNGILTFSTLT
jgi:hypothetical protein